MLKGDVVDWDTAKFDLVNMTEKEVPLESVCKPVKPGHVIMNKRTYESLVSLCKKFNAKTSVVDSAELQRDLSDIYLNTSFCSLVGSKYYTVAIAFFVEFKNMDFFLLLQAMMLFTMDGQTKKSKELSWTPTMREFLRKMTTSLGTLENQMGLTRRIVLSPGPGGSRGMTTGATTPSVGSVSLTRLQCLLSEVSLMHASCSSKVKVRQSCLVSRALQGNPP